MLRWYSRASRPIRISSPQVRLQRLADLEQDKGTLLESYSEKASRGLGYFTSEDRHQAHKELRLAVVVRPGAASRSPAY